MSAPILTPELVAAFKRLRLGGLLPTLDERLAMADRQDLPSQDVLLMLLTDEITRQDSSAATRRADDAGLDPDMAFAK